MGVLLTRHILPSDVVVIASQLVVAFLVKVEALGVKEIAARKNVEVVLIVLSGSVLNLLARVFFHSRNRLRRLDALVTSLRHHGC